MNDAGADFEGVDLIKGADYRQYYLTITFFFYVSFHQPVGKELQIDFLFWIKADRVRQIDAVAIPYRAQRNHFNLLSLNHYLVQ